MLKSAHRQLIDNLSQLYQHPLPDTKVRRGINPLQRSPLNEGHDDVRKPQVVTISGRAGDQTRRVGELGFRQFLQISSFVFDEFLDLAAWTAVHADGDLDGVSGAVGVLEDVDIVWTAGEGMDASVEDEGWWGVFAQCEG